MTRKPILPARDRRRLPGAIRFYSVFAYVTGVFLLLLVAEMVLKYVPWHDGYGYEVFANTQHGVQLVSADPVFVESAQGVNLSIGVLIVHGWLYVVYLIADFRLWTLLRWPLKNFILIALGGVVPFLSFIVEHFMSARARRDLADANRRAEEHDTAIATLRAQVAADAATAGSAAADGTGSDPGGTAPETAASDAAAREPR